MSENTPEYVHKAQVISFLSQPVIAAILLVGFFIWGCPSKQAQLTSEQVKSYVQAEVANAEIRIRKEQAERAPFETAQAKSQSALAEIEAAKSSKPILHIIPTVEQSVSFRDIRQIRIEARFENAGLVDLPINEVKVEVYRGEARADVIDIVNRTERIAEALRVLEQFGLNDPYTTPDWARFQEDDLRRVQKAWDDFQELRKNCPHGNIFLISDDSKSVTWTTANDLEISRRTSQILRPSQSAFESFVFLVTEETALHYRWFRFRLTVNPYDSTEQAFQFVIPALRPQVTNLAPTMSVSMKAETSTVWRPNATLLPTRPTLDEAPNASHEEDQRPREGN